jgi:hypothetical protein
MGLTLRLDCAGCGATREVRADGHALLYAGVVRTPEEITGWVLCDPSTGLCYCPACWASIAKD